MTAASPLLDLDDAASVAAADTDGAMRAAALGGAQVRSVAEASAEGVLDRLRGMRPRSVVMVTGGGRAARAANVLAASVGPGYGLPLLHQPEVPPWVGSLDVVVVAGDDPGDPRLVAAADSTLRRGAELVALAPAQGPLRDAAAGRGTLLAPRIPLPDRQGFLRYLAGGLALLQSLDSGRGVQLPDLGSVADQLDVEAARNNPSAEVFHNPAKSLAVRMQNRRVVIAGDGAATIALAAHATDMLLLTAGVAGAPSTLSDTIASAGLLAGRHQAPPGYDPIFHDEELDGPAPIAPARAFVLATTGSQAITARRLTALPDAELVVASDEPIAEFDGAERLLGMAGGDTPGRVAAGSDRLVRTETEQLATLAVRLEMAAVYLRLIGGR